MKCICCGKEPKKVVWCKTCFERNGFEDRKLIRIVLLKRYIKRLEEELEFEEKSELW